MTDPREQPAEDPREVTGEGEPAAQEAAADDETGRTWGEVATGHLIGLDGDQGARVIALREARELLQNQDGAYPSLRPGTGELVVLATWILDGKTDLSLVEEPDTED